MRNELRLSRGSFWPTHFAPTTLKETAVASVIGAGPWPASGGQEGAERRTHGHRGNPSKAHRSAPDSRRSRLTAVHGDLSSGAEKRIGEEEIAAFAPLAVSLEAYELLAEVDTYLVRGFSTERVFVELLAPAARYLGAEWTADRLDFLDVTMALWRLQEVLREVAARSGRNIVPSLSRRVLFSPFPGDQHSFGAAMIDECFTRAGWNSDLLIEPTRPSLLARVAGAHYDIIGLTVSCDCHIAPLSSLIVAVRNVSRNPHLQVMLGGRVLIEDPDLAQRAGADGTAATAIDALALAERLTASSLIAAFA